MNMRLNLATQLDDFRRFGEQTAVVRYTGNRRRATSYKTIARLAGRFAALLAELGIGSGDRVVLWGENSAEWIAAFYGCMVRGVIVVPLDAYGTAEFAERVAADVRPALIVGDAALLAGLQGKWPRLAFEEWADSLPNTEAGAVAGLSHDTPLQILFTSGTTGEPKGIVHTHGNVLASIEPIERAAQAYMKYERLVHPLRFLHTLPLSHVFGQTMGLWMPPIFAAEVHFENRLTGARLVETARRERISVIAAVPRVLALLKSHMEAEFPGLAAARIASAQGISAAKRWWRFRDVHAAFGFKFWAFITGGGALPGPVEEFWNALGFVLVQGYGMTETAALITLNHPFKVARGTLGKPLPGREVKLGADGEVLVRGAMISPATWSAGALHKRPEEWLATGDLARADPTGELRFIGRKSETIVTASGVNIHPEDIEAAFEQEPEVIGCAVVPFQTALGAEACAVLALRGSPGSAATIVQRANTRLADFQRIRRWAVWPEPDLPRTSTGKVRRALVAKWAMEREAVGRSSPGSAAVSVSGKDWLLDLISGISGERVEASPHDEHDLRLSEDLRIDSLGRIQLLEALEQRLGIALNAAEYDRVETLGALRELAAQASPSETPITVEYPRAEEAPVQPEINAAGRNPSKAIAPPRNRGSARKPLRFVYSEWPWWGFFRLPRSAFVECVLRPLVWFLAAPRVVHTGGVATLNNAAPMLIVANHVTSFDVPLLLYGLPRELRDRTAVAMSGEMLEDFRHARNLKPYLLNPLGPAAWVLMTAFFNVFPLPRKRDFQRSFAHAGRALDRGFHVVVFPEGTRSIAGELASFRPGIGLLVKQSYAAVLPMALVGLGDLKVRGRGWFRSGRIEVRVGEPIRFMSTDSEAAITARLHSAVEILLGT